MISLRRIGLGAALFGLSCLPSAEAPRAATTSATIAVSATVLSFCTVAALPLAFGNYSPSTVSTANTTVTVLCTAGTPFSVALDAGTGTGATVTARLMTGLSGATLGYGLYSNATLSTVWGHSAGSNTVDGAGTGLPQQLTVYGRIAAGQNVTPGAYTDTVLVTLTY